MRVHVRECRYIVQGWDLSKKELPLIMVAFLCLGVNAAAGLALPNFQVCVRVGVGVSAKVRVRGRGSGTHLLSDIATFLACEYSGASKRKPAVSAEV